MTKKRIHLIYSIVLSVLLAIAGICLIVACVGIYNFKPGSFSRESVAAAFQNVALPVYLCLGWIIGGIVLDLVIPVSEKKRPAHKQYGTILEKLQKKVDITKCEPALCRAILKEQQARTTHTIIGGVLLVVCSGIFLFYALNGSNYPGDANTAVVQAMKLFLPCLLIPFGYAVFTAYFKNRSICKEIDLLKQAIANGAQADSPAPVPAEKKETAVVIFRYAILGIAVAVLIGGFVFGGTGDVLAKAAAICTECVGLG